MPSSHHWSSSRAEAVVCCGCAGSMAAAVAAAAQDSGLEEAWLQGSHAQLQQRDGNSCWGGDAPLTADIRPLSSFVVSKPGNTLEGARQQTLSMSRGPSGLKLGSTVTAASVRAAKADAAHMPPYTTNGSNPEGRRREAASSSSMHRGHTGSAGGNGTIRQPSPTISGKRGLCVTMETLGSGQQSVRGIQH